MAKSYRPYFPEQDFLLPPSLREWLAEDHLAYFVSDLIDELDLGAIESHYEREERGYPPYHPRMMTKVLVYGYCVGVFSSRRLESGWLRTSHSACWQRATSLTFAPSRSFAGFT
jgi:transposase